ncbi:MAG TPA: hypothetical protein VMB50_00600 [Myxococcales bacterium]|nr:hypothetical protein [Myxococcales bacterium]
MTTFRKQALAALAITGLASCHKQAAAPKIPERPALATLLFTGDGWGEYAPCG